MVQKLFNASLHKLLNMISILVKIVLMACFMIPFVSFPIDAKLDTLNNKLVKVYRTEISNNCFELGIIYGGCKANIELLTDNQLMESQSLKL